MTWLAMSDKLFSNQVDAKSGKKPTKEARKPIDDTYLDGERIDIPDQGIETGGFFSFRKLWLYTGPGWLSKSHARDKQLYFGLPLNIL